MPEAVVDRVEYVPHRWFKVYLKGFERPIMVHWNWFVKHGRVYEGGYQDVLKPGDKISFEFARSPHPSDKENLYVRNLVILKAMEVETDVSI